MLQMQPAVVFPFAGRPGRRKQPRKNQFQELLKGNTKAIQKTLFMGYYITVKALVLHRSLFYH